jgi:hypothetical protein
MRNRKMQRPRTLYEVSPKELRQAVEKMCRELRISPLLAGATEIIAACEQERQNAIDKRPSLFEA